MLALGCHDTQHNNAQHNDTQHNAEHCYADCQLCSVSFIVTLIYKPFMLSVIMLSVVAPLLEQETLTEWEALVRLTSSLG